MKHARKNLMIPILIFAFVMVVAMCICMTQIFFAFGDSENDTLKNSNFETTQVEKVDVEEGVSQGREGKIMEAEEENLHKEVNADPRQVTAAIKLNTNEPFSGFVYDVQSGQKVRDFYAFTGIEFATFQTITEGDISEGIKAREVTEDVFHRNLELDFDHYTYLEVYDSTDTNDEISDVYIIVLSKLFYAYAGVSVSYTMLGDAADVIINVTPSYYIGFNANGEKFIDGESVRWISQGEFNCLKTPAKEDIEPASGKRFGGWYTHPVWGERVDENSLVPAWGELTMLYAHWVNENEPIIFNFTTTGFGQVLNFDYYVEYTLIDSKVASNYILNINRAENFLMIQMNPDYDYYEESNNKMSVEVVFYNDEGEYCELWIRSISGQRLNDVKVNGSQQNFLFRENRRHFTMVTSQYNNVEISTGWALPGYISVTSDNGQLLDCNKYFYSTDMGVVKSEYHTDSMFIPLGSNDYVWYKYGGYTNNIVLDEFSLNAPEILSSKIVIIVISLVPNPGSPSETTVYTFDDNLFSLFDWFDINSYIKGLSVDGEEIPMASYAHPIENGLHSFILNMTDKKADTTVTYNANGGHFADDSVTMTVDATYGETLPLVENPVQFDNDFVGWFTEPEGGQQVDPSNFNWEPWQKWDGVILYAHWTYNPHPVPPEPVPPVPPTPVDPGTDVPQTSDFSGIALVITAMLALCGASGFAASAKRRRFDK